VFVGEKTNYVEEYSEPYTQGCTQKIEFVNEKWHRHGGQAYLGHISKEIGEPLKLMWRQAFAQDVWQTIGRNNNSR